MTCDSCKDDAIYLSSDGVRYCGYHFEDRARRGKKYRFMLPLALDSSTVTVTSVPLHYPEALKVVTEYRLAGVASWLVDLDMAEEGVSV